MTDERDGIRRTIANAIQKAASIGYGDCMNERESEFEIAQLGDSTAKAIQALIDQVAKARIEAFDVAFDCHDYDKLRAYRAKLLKEVK